jgi:putative peptide maturation dehydrogenase
VVGANDVTIASRRTFQQRPDESAQVPTGVAGQAGRRGRASGGRVDRDSGPAAVARLRRTAYAFFRVEDDTVVRLDLGRGTAKEIRNQCIIASSVLTGKEYRITAADLNLLLHVPSDRWVAVTEILDNGQVDAQSVRELVIKGLVVSDQPDRHAARLRKQDENLSSMQWHPYAALYHFMTKWHDQKVLFVDAPDSLQQLEKRYTTSPATIVREHTGLHGPPPQPFHAAPNPVRVCKLPLIKRTGALYELLARRTTTRAFNPAVPVTLEQLSTILYHVYGCHGYLSISGDLVGLRKTSPSGGGLHPIEVYPLVINIEGLDSGIYHYNVKVHSLEMLERLTRADAAALANEFTAGQGYPSLAQVMFVMTARFHRSFWKYGNYAKAYSVILMDAAHLSQTLYLVCTELGLGAYVSAAINAVNVERRLRLDGYSEGAIAVCGCGWPGGVSSHLNPEFVPYIPRVTKVSAAKARSDRRRER